MSSNIQNQGEDTQFRELDKAIRYAIGRTLFPVTISCDNKSAGDIRQKRGCYKIKNFDNSIEEIQRKISVREKTGEKCHMAETHGDYIKQCVEKGRVIVK